MKKHSTLKAALAAVLAALMAFAVFPVSAMPSLETENTANNVEPYWTVPEGYDPYDYNKCAAFLEQADVNGVKNGQKLNPNYDPNDPDTWVAGSFSLIDENDLYDESGWREWFNPDGGGIQCPMHMLYDEIQIGFGWYDCGYYAGGVKHVRTIVIPILGRIYEKNGRNNPYINEETDWDLAGSMDFSGMEWLNNFIVHSVYGREGYTCYEAINSIDLSNCDQLSVVCCLDSSVTELNLAGDRNILWLDCYLSGIEGGLDISALEESNSSTPHLDYLNIMGMALTEFEFPHIGIENLRCGGNFFDSLDLSNLTYLHEFWDNFDGPDWDSDYLGLQELKYCGRICRVEGNGNIHRVEYLYSEIEECWFNDSISVISYDSTDFAGWYDESGNLLCEQTTLYFDEGATGVFIAKFVSEEEPIPGDVDGDGEVTALDALSIMRLLVSETDGSDMNVDAADMNGDGVVDILDALLALRMAIGA